MCSCVYPLFINKIISSIWICVILNNCKLDKMIKVSGGTYKVRNEIETKRNETKRNEINENETKRNETKSTKTKRNETKSTKWKRNKTKPTKAKRNQRKQNEIRCQTTSHTCLSAFHQERTGFDHHWTRILCIYLAEVCPLHLVASFKFGNHKSNVKSVERRGIKITEVQ